jgi:hypothetical protein
LVPSRGRETVRKIEGVKREKDSQVAQNKARKFKILGEEKLVRETKQRNQEREENDRDRSKN